MTAAQELMAAFDADRHATEARDEVLARMDSPLPGDGFLIAEAEVRHAELMAALGSPRRQATWVDRQARVMRTPDGRVEVAGSLLVDVVREAVDEVVRAMDAPADDPMREALDAYRLMLRRDDEQSATSRARYSSCRWDEGDDARPSDEAWADLSEGLCSELTFGVHVAEKLGLALLDAARPDLRRVA